MKIFIRPESGAPAEWPEGFISFFNRNAEFGEHNGHFTVIEGSRIIVPHGRNGARIIFTVDGYLPESWKVSAFHSDIVSELGSFDPNSISRADGIIVAGKNFNSPLGIATADCLAVAVTSETASDITAASCFHAGWRGYSAGIQQNALSQMWAKAEQSGMEKEAWLRSLRVTVGPAISGQSYPCGKDVLEALQMHIEHKLRPLAGWTDECERLFASAVSCPQASSVDDLPETEKIYPDLQSLMVLELYAYGLALDQLAIVREDTFSSTWWPSHRRAMAQGLEKAGRLVTHLCPPACPQVQNRDSYP
jgi:copper oxidase (laccase) domain-containing protein